MSMSNRSRTPMTTDFYNIVGVTTTSSIKEICKAYKSIMKWSGDHKNHDKSHADLKEAYVKVISRFDQEVHLNISNPTKTITNNKGYDHHKSADESFFSRPNSSTFSRNMSRRSKTPNPMSSSSRNDSSDQDADFPERSLRGRRSSSTNRRCAPPETHIHSSGRKRTGSRRSAASAAAPAAPIVFSQSTAKKTPLPLERKLDCTLEELLEGCSKKIKITRDVIAETGRIVQEEEIIWVKVKPGWRKGTKIMLEGKGDEKPGYLPADIVLLIDEIRHPLYGREGDDLEIVVEIPLVNALTGCSIPVPLLGGDKMSLSFDDIIIFHGYEKVIRGQGMPKAKEQGTRGDLRIKFLVEFPDRLTTKQRAEAVGILRDCP